MNYHSFQALGAALRQYHRSISSICVNYQGDEGFVSKTTSAHVAMAPLETELSFDDASIELEDLRSVCLTLKTGEELFF